MKPIFLFRLIPALMGVLLLSGCQFMNPAKDSGFLVSYSALTPDPNDRNVRFYHNPDHPPEQIAKQYPAFMIDPIAVYFHPDAIGRPLKPDDLKELTDYFQRELAAGLNKRFFVVDTPGPNVARIRIAVIGVSASHFRLTIHPTLAAVDLQHAAMELELVDAKTAERIMALTDTRPRGPYTKFDDLTIRKYSRAVVDVWIKEILRRMDTVFPAAKPPAVPSPEPASPPVIKNEGTDKSS